jgi:hypothetical protein
MPAIHLIKKPDDNLPTIKKVLDEENIYTSGYWTILEEKARGLINGKIYFHERQLDPSIYGGIITDVEKVSEGKYKGKIIFKFQLYPDCGNVRTPREGWSQEMKIL